jgi:hypothetical protein
MAEVKLKGADDLVRLMQKPDLWVPPANTANYLGFVLKVLASSRYKDLFMKLAPEDLHSVLKIKVARCFFEGTLDLEEIVDLGAYATLLYLRTSQELVDPKNTAKELVGQLRDMSCGVVTFKQELDKLPKAKVEVVESTGTSVGNAASVMIKAEQPASVQVIPSGAALLTDYRAEVERLRVENEKREELEQAKDEQTPTAYKRSPADEKFLRDFGVAEKTKNGNCLLDMKCPKCGSLEPFDILVTCWTKVYDDGTDTANGHNWDNGSLCNCFKCNHKGKVADFRAEKSVVTGTLVVADKQAKKPKKKKGARCHTLKRTCSSTKKR